jgi:hypothetical protein
MTRKSSGRGALVARRAAFRAALLAWYRANRRRLPWRESPSPYATVVSEFMLQQTQVATVLPYFGRWMAALPGFASLAAAPEATVLLLWEGLGYYSRARNLHRLARELAGRPLPRLAAQWRELPGVGPVHRGGRSRASRSASPRAVRGRERRADPRPADRRGKPALPGQRIRSRDTFRAAGATQLINPAATPASTTRR